MRRTSRAQSEADRLLLAKIRTLLDDPDDWDDYEDQRRWLRKLLQRDDDATFTEPERAAVQRVYVARTHLHSGWDGYTIQELAVAASKYRADFGNYESEEFVKELLARGTTRLRSKDMEWLVGLARASGVDISAFRVAQVAEEDAHAA